jgi:hypothetical protein
MYGASRAEKLISSHPNHEHLLKVLRETRLSAFSENAPQTRQQFPSRDSPLTSQLPEEQFEPEQFDSDTLLSDDQVNREYKDGNPRQN